MKKIISIVIFITTLCVSLNGFALNRIAFFYNTNPPTHLFSFFQNIVIQPYAHINPVNYSNKKNIHLYTYISLGELSKNSPLTKEIKKNWVIAENKAWGSLVMDASNPNWQTFFIEKIVTPLIERGFHGIFFDTADSYMIAAKTPKARAAQEAGLVSIIKRIHSNFPYVKILMNRGFDLLPQVHQLLTGIVAESLYDGWSPTKKKYIKISSNDNTYLEKKLTDIRNKYHLPAIVISYLPESKRSAYLALAQRIAHHGFVPWVTNHTLNAIGVSDYELKSRRVMFAYYNPTGEDLYGENSPAFRYLGMPLEYLGYIPSNYNAFNPMSLAEKNQHFAGIVLFVDKTPETYPKPFLNWLVKEKEKGTPILFFDGFPFPANSKYLNTFGLTTPPGSVDLSHLKLSPSKKHVGFEMNPTALQSLPRLITKRTKDTWLALRTKKGKTIPVIGTTSWGGYVESGYGHRTRIGGISKLIIDPYAMLQHMLKLDPIPAADTTTENGTRLMMAQIDGDGFVNRAEFNQKKFSSQIIDEDILRHYKIPTTVSIVEGEIGKAGLYPSISKQAEAVAQDIFKPPYIELASHSYSHPFDWRLLEGTGKVSIHQNYNLPIKGYKFNLTRDIKGSVNYINTQLAPAGKKVQVFLWTGNADPSENAVKMTYNIGLMNMNGGATIISKNAPSLTKVSPIGVDKGGYYQVYAPIGNEIYYTNDWSGPYFGFKNVIQTFKMTNTPRRLKPIDVYYHFYSGDKLASLNALKTIFNWTNTQHLMHIFVSDYAKKALDFVHATYAKTDHGWLVFTNGNLRELRILKTNEYPDFKLSQNVIGFSDYKDSRYIHLGSDYKSKIILTKNKPITPYLQRANAHVTKWKIDRKKNKITASFNGFDPLQIEVNNVLHCSTQLDSEKPIVQTEVNTVIQSSRAGEHDLEIKCTK